MPRTKTPPIERYIDVARHYRFLQSTGYIRCCRPDDRIRPGEQRSYILTQLQNGDYQCDCPHFQARHICKHISGYAILTAIQDGRAAPDLVAAYTGKTQSEPHPSRKGP